MADRIFDLTDLVNVNNDSYFMADITTDQSQTYKIKVEDVQNHITKNIINEIDGKVMNKVRSLKTISYRRSHVIDIKDNTTPVYDVDNDATKIGRIYLSKIFTGNNGDNRKHLIHYLDRDTEDFFTLGTDAGLIVELNIHQQYIRDKSNPNINFYYDSYSIFTGDIIFHNDKIVFYPKSDILENIYSSPLYGNINSNDTSTYTDRISNNYGISTERAVNVVFDISTGDPTTIYETIINYNNNINYNTSKKLYGIDFFNIQGDMTNGYYIEYLLPTDISEPDFELRYDVNITIKHI